MRKLTTMCLIFSSVILAGLFFNINTALAQEVEAPANEADCPKADQDEDGRCPDVIEVVNAEPLIALLERHELTSVRVDFLVKPNTGRLALMEKRADANQETLFNVKDELHAREISLSVGGFYLSDFSALQAAGGLLGLGLPLGEGRLTGVLAFSAGGLLQKPGDDDGMNLALGLTTGVVGGLTEHLYAGVTLNVLADVGENGNDVIFAAAGFPVSLKSGAFSFSIVPLLGHVSISKEISDSGDNEEKFGMGGIIALDVGIR